MDGKSLINYGITALVVYLVYRILAPIIEWIVYLIPTAAIVCIIVGFIKMYTEK